MKKSGVEKWIQKRDDEKKVQTSFLHKKKISYSIRNIYSRDIKSHDHDK